MAGLKLDFEWAKMNGTVKLYRYQIYDINEILQYTIIPIRELRSLVIVNYTLQKKEVCAQLFVPAKRFKICHIYKKRKPTYFFRFSFRAFLSITL